MWQLKRLVVANVLARVATRVPNAWDVFVEEHKSPGQLLFEETRVYEWV